MSAGFRACKICKPLGDHALAALVNKMKSDPERIWREKDFIDEGFEPRTLRRQVEALYGIKLSELTRGIRIKSAMEDLERGQKVVDGQLAAGFSSAQGFRDAFLAIIGLRPSDFRENARFLVSWLETPIGDMIAIADDEALQVLEFTDRKKLSEELKRFHQNVDGDLGFGRTKIHEQTERELSEFFAGNRARFDVPIVLHGEGFTKAVWQALREIPAGQTRSYAELAASIGKPKAFRAVANANARNQIAIIVPCHRVIGADGKLAGYAGGVWRKEKLLEIEKGYGRIQK